MQSQDGARHRNDPTHLMAWLAAALFIPVFALLPSGALPSAVQRVGIVIHLILFPVVSRAPAPQWGKAAGYAWLGFDVTASVILLQQGDAAMAFAVRLGGHVLAGLWIGSVAFVAQGGFRLLGLGLGFSLGGYSLVTSFVPLSVFGISAPLMVAWLFWLGIRLRSLPAENTLTGGNHEK